LTKPAAIKTAPIAKPEKKAPVKPTELKQPKANVLTMPVKHNTLNIGHKE
jgi:hypothetical protein